MATSRFPNSMKRFADTYGSGGISINCVELQTGDDGCVEAPAAFAKEMAPHGFVMEGTKEFSEWEKSRPAAQPQPEPQRQGRR